MSLVDIKDFMTVPDASRFPVAAVTNVTLDAAGERGGSIFQVPKSGNVHNVWLRTGTVTEEDSLKVSLQGVNSVGMPDGTILGTGSAGYATATMLDTDDSKWLGPFALGVDVTVTRGQWISTVVEYSSYSDGNLQIAGSNRSLPTYNTYTVTDTAAPQTSGSLTVGSTYHIITYNADDDFTNVGASSNAAGVCFVATGTTPTHWEHSSSLGVWAKGVQGSMYCVALEYDDGTYMPIVGASYYTSLSVGSGTTPDEVGNYFQVPFPCEAIGLWIYADFDYDGTLSLQNSSGTTLANCTFDADVRFSTSASHFEFFFDSDPASSVSLAKDTWYQMVYTPADANQNSLRYVTVPEDDAMGALGLGTNCYYQYRTDGGEWTRTATTKRLVMGLLIDKVDNGVSSGSGVYMPSARQIGV